MNAPNNLSPEARKKFDELAAQVGGKAADIPAELLSDLLAQYATAHAMREYALAEIARELTLLASAPNGTRYPSPYLKIVEQCERRMDTVFRRLGFGKRTAAEEPEGIDL